MIRHPEATAAGIASIVVFATVGDVLIASAMRQIHDLDKIRTERGIMRASLAVITNLRFLAGVAGMTLSFFSLLYSLSHADVSLVAPASASLTFVTNAFAAKLFLKENVDRRRWAAALFIGIGVVLLTH